MVSSKQSEDQSNELEKEPEIRKESCPFCENHHSDKVAIRVHIASTHFKTGGNNLNRIPFLDNQETCLKCTLCRKMINKSKMKKHMQENHADESILVSEEEDQDTCLKCLLCRKMINKSKMKNHMDERHGDESLLLSDEEDQPTLEDNAETRETMEKEDNTEDDNVGTVILVKRKTLWWPAIKIKSDGSAVSVKLLNKTRTKVIVSMKHVKPFKVDHSNSIRLQRDNSI